MGEMPQHFLRTPEQQTRAEDAAFRYGLLGFVLLVLSRCDIPPLPGPQDRRFPRESVEPDYEYAADAWMEQAMTVAMMRHNSRCQQIAAEYAKRLELEKAGHPLGPYEETP